jgi:hypothetical protein
LRAIFSGGYSAYNFEISSTQVPELAYKLALTNQTHFKTVFDYYLEQHTLNFGLSTPPPPFSASTSPPMQNLWGSFRTRAGTSKVPFLSVMLTVNKKLSIDLGLQSQFIHSTTHHIHLRRRFTTY